MRNKQSIQTQKQCCMYWSLLYASLWYIYTRGAIIIQTYPANIIYCTSPHTPPPKCMCECCNVLLHGQSLHIYLMAVTSAAHVGLGASASTPVDHPFLHCVLLLWIGSEACCYCGCIEPHSFKDCPANACSLSAHVS